MGWFRKTDNGGAEDFTVSPDPYADQLDRIELMLRLVMDRLDELFVEGDDEELPELDLDGQPAGGERKEGTPL